jgi:hypothetical protein
MMFIPGPPSGCTSGPLSSTRLHRERLGARVEREQEEKGSKRVKTEAGVAESEAKVEEGAMSDVADAASDRSSSPEIAENWPKPYNCGSIVCQGGCHKR